MLDPCSGASENKTSASNTDDDMVIPSQPHGRIQKISQEGSKNTYVIILSKDCLKSDSSIGQSLRKIAPDVNRHGHSHTGRYKGQTLNAELHICGDREYDSPTIDSGVNRTKLSNQSEDVKLNLSKINDDEYDSNHSACSVFFKQESSCAEQDSAVDLNTSQSISGNSLYLDQRSIYSFKPDMNSYVISSPLMTTLQKKQGLEQHIFPVTNRSNDCSQYSKISFSGTNSSEKSFGQPSTRKIVLITPDSDTCKSLPKNTVKYTTNAVPVLDRSATYPFITPSTLLLKNNAKAVPTFSNISPINQYDDTKATSKSAFIPINQSEFSAFGDTTHGPLTSTPVIERSSLRFQQLKQESSNHRPVYIIQSPFSRQCSNTAATSTPIAQGFIRSIENQSPLLLAPRNATSSMNNSSGFISGSSSMETHDASCSFECTGVQSDTCPKNIKESFVEISLDGSVKGTGDGCGGVVIAVEDPDDERDVGLSGENDPLTSSQESEASEKAEKAGLNRSLTNIQWLKGMQLKDEKTSTPTSSTSQQHQNIQWTALSSEEIRKISSECGREKRPPFSYMSMIQMALYSREDRKMMLKEICKWIEDTFPYYKFTAKPGWKNSIRHNLSLYNIFEREPSKRHGSYWTIKSDVEPKTKHYHREKLSSSSETHRSLPTLTSQIPIIPVYNSMGQLSTVTQHSYHQSKHCPLPSTASTTGSKKKAPLLILPRPTAYSTPQAYALIPLSGVNQSFSPTSPMMRNLTSSASACPSPIISEVSAAVASIQMSSTSPISHEYFCDTLNFAQEHIYTKKPNIVKQAWIDCHSRESPLADTEVINQSEVMTSSSEIASSSEFSGNRAKSKRPRIKPGLPKPKIYKDDQKRPKSGGKRRRLHQTERPLFNDSSEQEDDGTIFISNLQKEIFSGSLKPLGTQDYEEMLTTSTPLKSQSSSTGDLPSPIRGLTPLRDNSIFDGSFLDSKALGMSPGLNDCKKSSLNSSPKLDSPEECLLDFNLLPFPSPDRYDASPGHNNGNLSNQNLSRILNEYCLDTAVDNPEQFPNLNWSVVQQMVDSMDTA